jgi:hypothetical protein
MILRKSSACFYRTCKRCIIKCAHGNEPEVMFKEKLSFNAFAFVKD